TIGPFVRIVSLRIPGLPATDANSLVAHDNVSSMLIARRAQFAAFLIAHGVKADVAYAVSASESHSRASAWYTTDAGARPGVGFTLDGRTLSHRHWYRAPGTVAIHTSSSSLTALHEFQHAASSYTNGQITDLYVDSAPALNCKRGRPIPSTFCTYNGVAFGTDAARDGLGYPANWQSYNCALHAGGRAPVRADYLQGS